MTNKPEHISLRDYFAGQALQGMITTSIETAKLITDQMEGE